MSNCDPTGESLVGAIIGGALAGAIIGTVSHLVSCGRSGSDVTASGLLKSAGLGALTGAAGAVGGVFGGTCAVAASAFVGITSGVITAINTEGSITERIVTGLATGVVSGIGTYFGTLIPVALDSNFAAGFTSFSGGMFMGAQTEIANVAAQHAVSELFERIPKRQKTSHSNTSKMAQRFVTAY